jgi:hypothetical protein
MKNLWVFLFFLIIWGLAGAKDGYAVISQQQYEGYSSYPPYPYVLSQPIAVLPERAITISVGDETYYYSHGSFYKMVERIQKYILVPAPIGAVVFKIPKGYQLMVIDGVSYYQYGGVFYKRVLDGYRVIYPPVQY